MGRPYVNSIIYSIVSSSLAIIILNIIGSFKVFDIIWVMTSGGPAGGSETLVVSMFRESFSMQNFGYGSAIAL